MFKLLDCKCRDNVFDSYYVHHFSFWFWLSYLIINVEVMGLTLTNISNFFCFCRNIILFRRNQCPNLYNGIINSVLLILFYLKSEGLGFDSRYVYFILFFLHKIVYAI